MRRVCAQVAGAWVILIAQASAISADPIGIRPPRRFASAGASVLHGTAVDIAEQLDRDNLVALASTAIGPNTATATTKLLSTISADGFRIFGRADTSWSAAAAGNNDDRSESVAGARADIDWDFEIDHPQLFELQANFTKTPLNRFGFWQASLESPEFGFVFGHHSFAPEAVHLIRRLQPGIYSFQFETNTSGETFKGSASGRGELAFDINVNATASPTPEPASITLLAIGIIAAVALRTWRSLQI